ncbi:MAG: 4-hydroxy-tetrahydrodipicolinate reductase, partial [Marinosulfonomonas sp.]
MKIALIGYGKMGKEIERLALEKGHEISLKVNSSNADSFSAGDLDNTEVAIEFSTPKTVYENIIKCFESNIPVVVGTTGWLDKLAEVNKRCIDDNQTLFYAPNFSIGVNIFFEINQRLAKLMD